MASSALTNRLLTPNRSSIRSFCSKVYYIVKPFPQYARDDTPDDLGRAGLLIEEKDDALYFQKAMPGLGPDDIKAEIDPTRRTLTVTGEPGGYKTLLHLPLWCVPEEGVFKMENGLLSGKVPKKMPSVGGPSVEAQWECKPEPYKPGDTIPQWEGKPEHSRLGATCHIVGYQLQDE